MGKASREMLVWDGLWWRTGHRRKLLGRWVHLVWGGCNPCPLQSYHDHHHHTMVRGSQIKGSATGPSVTEMSRDVEVSRQSCTCTPLPLPDTLQHTSPIPCPNTQSHTDRGDISRPGQKKKKKRNHMESLPLPNSCTRRCARLAVPNTRLIPPLPGAHSRS